MFSSDIAWFKQCIANKKLIKHLKKITFIITDIDGSLTSGHVYVSSGKEEGRMFSTQDGYVFFPAMKNGLTIAFMSGKKNASTLKQGKILNIPEELCLTGIIDKSKKISELQKKMNFSSEQTCIFGDDYLDISSKLNNVVSLFACPNNTPFYIQKQADIIIPKDGGAHAFRLFMDLLLYIQEKHFAQNLIKQSLEC